MDEEKPSGSSLRTPTQAHKRNSNTLFAQHQNSLNKSLNNSTIKNDLSETPKRLRLDDLANTSVLNISASDPVPGSPWEWRKMKAEVNLKL